MGHQVQLFTRSPSPLLNIRNTHVPSDSTPPNQMSLPVARARVERHWVRVPVMMGASSRMARARMRSMVLKQCELHDDWRRSGSRIQLSHVHPRSRCASPHFSACAQRTSTGSLRSIMSGACSYAPVPASQTPHSLAAHSSLIQPRHVAHIVASHCQCGPLNGTYIYVTPSYMMSTTGAFAAANPSAGMLGGYEHGCGNDSVLCVGVGFWQSYHGG